VNTRSGTNAVSIDMGFDPLASIQRFYDAENEYVRSKPEDRDLAGMLAELDPEVVVHVPDSLPHGGIWRGHSGFRSLFASVVEHWSEFEVVYDEDKWHQIDDRRVLVEGRLRACLRSNGRRVDMKFVSLITFSELGASYLDHYYKDTAAIVAQEA
jgi:ketosteroid isomerase-like protein